MKKVHFPPEWAPQDGVQLTWPNDRGDWAPYLPQVEPVFVAIAREVAQRETLLINCYDDEHCRKLAERLQAAGVAMPSVRLYPIASNDTWARDHGPITVLVDEQPQLLDFKFNGWGGKYPADLDNRITAAMAEAGAFVPAPRPIDLILEGGGIETDGAGTLLTTRRCLLAPTRNPQYNQTQLEQRLTELLGVDRFLWLQHGDMQGDDTDGHIDTLARFCSIDTIAFQACDDPDDSHYAELQAMADELRDFRTRAGHPYRLVELPWPKAKHNAAGDRLPATYANFLIINDAVLLPTYGDPADERAIAALQGCFPDRDIVPIDCSALILQFGSLHCVTMQFPRGVLA